MLREKLQLSFDSDKVNHTSFLSALHYYIDNIVGYDMTCDMIKHDLFVMIQRDIK